MAAVPGAREMLGVLSAAATDHTETLNAYVSMLSPAEARNCLITLSRYTVRVMIAAGQAPLNVIEDAAFFLEDTESWDRQFEEMMQSDDDDDPPTD